MRRFSTVRLDGARPRHAGAIDTARVATETKLVSEVTRVITTAWTKLGRPFFVVPVPMPDGVLEAWAILRATKARHLVTGGDVACVRSADGTLRRTVDHTSTWTQVPLAAAGAVVLRSAEQTDLVTARYHTDLGREVTVHTTTVECSRRGTRRGHRRACRLAACRRAHRSLTARPTWSGHALRSDTCAKSRDRNCTARDRVAHRK